VQSPAIAVAKTVIFWSYYLFFYFRPPIFRCPWADFRETLPHNAVCPEIVHLLYGCLCVPPKNWQVKTPNFADFQTQNRHLEPHHSLMQGKSANLNNSVNLWLYEHVHTKHGGGPPPTSEIGCPLGVWGESGKFWIDITSAVWQLATRCLILGVCFRGQAVQWRHSWDRGTKGRCHGNQFWD